MHPLLEEIFKTREFKTSKNETVSISSETSRNQCEYLQKIIRDNHYISTLEIGFAFGMSTLAITEQVVKNGGSHIVIDKFENTAFSGYGLDLIKQAGLSERLKFIEEYCYVALPLLYQEGKRFDFAYVDSTKQLDWLLVDFFYIDKLLNVGGIITFDDVSFPGIRKLLRYLSQFPNYKIHSQHPPNAPSSIKRKLFELMRYLPWAKKYIKNELIKSDFELGVNSHCVSLKKIEDDQRTWSWHMDF